MRAHAIVSSIRTNGTVSATCGQNAKNTRLGDPKRVFDNDISMRLADLANLNVLLIFVHLGKIAQTGALHHVGAGGHREA